MESCAKVRLGQASNLCRCDEKPLLLSKDVFVIDGRSFRREQLLCVAKNASLFHVLRCHLSVTSQSLGRALSPQPYKIWILQALALALARVQ